MKKRFITVKKEDEGQRLDKIIPAYLPDLSRTHARSIIASGAVSINGKRVRKNSRSVRAGQTIVVFIDSLQKTDISQMPEIPVFLDDKWFIVVNKPAGIPADETKLGHFGTLTCILKERFKFQYIQTVHRLDRGTSGIMVLSKTPAATKDLNRQFRERLVKKTYFAVVQGKPSADRGVIDTKLAADAKDPRKMKSVVTGGKQAVTEFEVLASTGNSSLLKVSILTGRKHQIRVHLSESGHPVLGDKQYGIGDPTTKRLMLHAGVLQFQCPRTGKPVIIESDIPGEFTEWVPLPR